MSKKTHIKVKRGILDRKHFENMGNKLWLYLYILDNTDWETGTIERYTDGNVAKCLGVPGRTVRSWRIGLENAGYIASRQGFQCLILYVHNWSNPREKWEDEEEMPPPDWKTTARQAMEYAAGAGLLPSAIEFFDTVYSLIQKHGEQKTKDALKLSYEKWKNTKSPNTGRFYSIVNYQGWVGWAVSFLNEGIEPWNQSTKPTPTTEPASFAAIRAYKERNNVK